MPNGAEARRRTDRGSAVHGVVPFSDEQRIWLLERDLDESEESMRQFREEVRSEMTAMRRLVTTRLNMIVGLGFSLLIAVVSVLVTVLANH